MNRKSRFPIAWRGFAGATEDRSQKTEDKKSEDKKSAESIIFFHGIGIIFSFYILSISIPISIGMVPIFILTSVS